MDTKFPRQMNVLLVLELFTICSVALGLVCRDCTEPCDRAGNCGTDGKCFVRRDVNNIHYRGCADKDRWLGLDITYNGCKYQEYLGWQGERALWCFCDFDDCNEVNSQVFKDDIPPFGQDILDITSSNFSVFNGGGRARSTSIPRDMPKPSTADLRDAKQIPSNVLGTRTPPNDGVGNRDNHLDIRQAARMNANHFTNHRQQMPGSDVADEQDFDRFMESLSQRLLPEGSDNGKFSMEEIEPYIHDYFENYDTKSADIANPNTPVVRSNGIADTKPEKERMVEVPFEDFNHRNYDSNQDLINAILAHYHASVGHTQSNAVQGAQGSGGRVRPSAARRNLQKAESRIKNEPGPNIESKQAVVDAHIPPEVTKSRSAPTMVTQRRMSARFTTPRSYPSITTRTAKTTRIARLITTTEVPTEVDTDPPLRIATPRGYSPYIFHDGIRRLAPMYATDSHRSINLMRTQGQSRMMTPEMRFPVITTKSSYIADRIINSTIGALLKPGLGNRGIARPAETTTAIPFENLFTAKRTDLPSPRMAPSSPTRFPTARDTTTRDTTLQNTTPRSTSTRDNTTRDTTTGLITTTPSSNKQHDATQPSINSTNTQTKEGTCFTQGDNKSCYVFIRDRMSHDQAKTYCEALPGSNVHLVSLDSVQEYSFLLAELRSREVLHDGWQGWWTAASYHSELREFVWSHNGKVLSKRDTRWHRDLLLNPHPDTCVWLVPLAGYPLGNYGCSQKTGFICESEQ